MAVEMEKNDSDQQMRAVKMAQQVKVLGKPDNLEPTWKDGCGVRL